jgi:glycosyltransferase involved in cell wall biosynthesis
LTTSLKTQDSSSLRTEELARGRSIGVGVLVYSVDFGGIDTIVLNWLKAMNRERFRTYLFTFAQSDGRSTRFLDKAAELGFTVYQIPWSRRKPLLRAARSLADYVRRFQIDILHCHDPYGNFVGALTKRYVEVKTVTTFHAWGESGWRLRVMEWTDVRLSRFFDQLTAVSEVARQGAVDLGIPREKIKILTICAFAPPRQYTSQERALKRAALGIQPDNLVFMSVARFFPFKRHDIMLQAFRQILDRYSQARLWTVGDGPEEAKMKNLAAQLGIADCINFLGYQTNVEQLLPLADVQIMTSDIGEGLPLAIVEGMAVGLPILATKVGQLPHLLTHDHSALLVNPGHPEEVAAAAIELIENPLKRQSLGVEARRLFEQQYVPQQGAASVEQFYANLVETP